MSFLDNTGLARLWEHIVALVSTKVEKVDGKSLSTNDYTTAEKEKLASISDSAEVNQNAFSNIVVGSTTIAADSKTDTLTLTGSNVTLTPNATSDSIQISVANGSTSVKGIVQLSTSTNSTSTSLAATASAVRSAYNLANTANTTANSALTTANGKADATHTHTVANITDLTATATELNYVDGVTSNIQTQLDGKVSTSTLSSYYTKTEVDNKGYLTEDNIEDLELITINDIDTICGTAIVSASDSGVTF